MTTALALESHIVLGKRRQARVAGTPYRVVDIALEHVFHGFSPTEIQYQHYGELTLAQIHAALAYYFDHKAQLDAAMQRELASAERQRAKAGESPVVKRLRAEGKLP